MPKKVIVILSIFLFSWVAFNLLANDEFKTVKTYGAPPDEANFAYALDLSSSPEGNLCVLDGKSSLVHVWDAKGHYEGHCGGEGQGPGECADLIRIALGAKFIYGFQFPGPLLVWPINETMKTANEKARKVQIKTPFAQIFKVLKAKDGKERLLIGGQTRDKEGKGPYSWFVVDPDSGFIREWDDYRQETRNPTWDLYSADGSQPLRVCPPRLWAASQGNNLMLGFSDNQRIWSVRPDGTLVKAQKWRLPQFDPDDESEKRFLETPIPIFDKSLKELGIKVEIDSKTPMAYYSYFVPLPNQNILLINTIFGGFNNVNFAQNGDSFFIYNYASGRMQKKGLLNLPDSAQLFPNDDRLYLVRFNDQDQLVIEQVDWSTSVP